MCYTWVWAMPVSHVACHSVPLCLPSLCSGRVPCVFISGSCQHVDMLVKPWTLKRYSESLASVWNVTLVMYQFMRFVDVTLLGKCFQLNLNQSNQIDLWMQLSVYVVVAILAKDVWKIFVLPPSLGPRTHFPSFSLSLAVWKMAPRFDPD